MEDVLSTSIDTTGQEAGPPKPSGGLNGRNKMVCLDFSIEDKECLDFSVWGGW